MHLNRFVFISLLSVLFLSLTGCIGGSTLPSNFYLLEPISKAEHKEAIDPAKILVALGPVRIPKYADRPQIVSAKAKNVYHLSELNRWAESLKDNITRVLSQNLSTLVPAEVLLTNSSKLAKQAKFNISVNILEFHVDSEGQAGLTVQWHLTDGNEKLLSRQLSYQVPASTSDYGIMVGALNECLNQMSNDMATSLRQIYIESKIKPH